VLTKYIASNPSHVPIMILRLVRTVLVSVVACSALLRAPSLSAQQPASPTPAVAAAHAPLRILWIGNSYTYVNDLPRTLTLLALAAGENRVPAITTVLRGGQFLRGHAARKDMTALMAQGWDYVVLQDQSLAPIEQPDTVLHYGTQLGTMAKKAGATVLLYVTWPRRDTPQTMGAIASTYAKLAQRIGATLVPVGPAWMAMREESPATELYIDDGSHPSPVGTYIAANVFYGVLYDKSPKGLPAQAFSVRGNRYVADTLPMALTPRTLTPMEAAAAQRAADRVLMSRSR
jgi:hypothetical protein